MLTSNQEMQVKSMMKYTFTSTKLQTCKLKILSVPNIEEDGKH